LRSSRRCATPGSCALSAAAIAGVRSVLALSATTIRQVNGNVSARKSCSRRTLRASAASSL
jgi:hypothetical protein